ncbi:hypothetical protein BCR43DRAFT_515308 [Syncephalastrum racemosum]|uniref:Uncharacterized protein n=1 Tax=Syncephalastrum racemosum TaxID=13706 RepID=A0A1X2HDY6_SYNRA|nr:hypothetical protein BCR43DRAFT_515308 [Syncephalastrum racemosum]
MSNNTESRSNSASPVLEGDQTASQVEQQPQQSQQQSQEPQQQDADKSAVSTPASQDEPQDVEMTDAPTVKTKSTADKKGKKPMRKSPVASASGSSSPGKTSSADSKWATKSVQPTHAWTVDDFDRAEAARADASLAPGSSPEQMVARLQEKATEAQDYIMDQYFDEV